MKMRSQRSMGIHTTRAVGRLGRLSGLAGIAAALGICLGATAASAQRGLNLYVGEVRVVKLAAVSRVAVGNGSLLSTSITEDGDLILLAEGAGDTGIHVWYRSGREGDLDVYIQESNSSRTLVEVRSALTSVPGVGARSIGSQIVLEGDYDPKYTQVVEALTGAFPGLLNLTTTLDAVQENMVHFHVIIAEFSVGDLSQLGVAWDTSINGPSAGGAAGTSSGGASLVNSSTFPENFAGLTPAFGYFGLATEITSRIDLLKQDNRAYVLAEPRLSTRSGGMAKFLVGGEIPIPVVTQNTTDVQFKEFGIRLELEPTLDPFGNVVSHVMAESSTVDESRAVAGTPGFATRRAETDISMSQGDTLVISGLVERALSESNDKLPFLGELPGPLGYAFKSVGKDYAERELVIFVTPTIINANAPINTEWVEKGQEMLRRFDEELSRTGDLIIY